MIYDAISRGENYFAVHPRLAKGLLWLQSAPIDLLPTGKHEIEGDKLFAIVDEYVTRPFERTKFESHRVYGDIQFVVTGTEGIDVCGTELLQVTEAYDEKRDVGFFASPDSASRLVLRANDFAVFFPSDGHRPQIALADPLPVRKIVVKFAVGDL
jgi:YhcH/YjgK/YiaL family protein